MIVESPKLKIEAAVPNFFFIPMKKVEIATNAETGRTYFLLDGKIIAVAKGLPQDWCQ